MEIDPGIKQARISVIFNIFTVKKKKKEECV